MIFLLRASSSTPAASSLRFLIVRSLLVIGGVLAITQAGKAAEVSAAPAESASSGEEVQTQHSITLDGVQVAYTATAGRLRVGLHRSDAEALMFYVSYDKDGEDVATRPITFVFNGGPGSSAAWLHLGALAPKRLALSDEGAIPEPPARLADNAQTWLRFTDLVFIDPVGTGFSRAIGSAEKSTSEVGRHFWDIRNDLRSLAEFMRLYLTRKQRWASPKYLAGESYGGFRAAVLADALPAQGGIELNGVILISPVIEYTLNMGSDYLNLMPWVTFVPSYAATAFYHGKYRGDGRDLQRIAEAAESFSRTELLLALASGGGSDSPQTSRTLAQLAAITGLERGVVQRHHGRISAETFARRLLEDRGRVLGIYDGSISAPDPDPLSLTYPGRDPSFDPLVAPVVSSLNAYLRNELGYESELPYEAMNTDVLRSWDWSEAGLGENPGVGTRLRRALALNPKLKVLVAHGYFDLATPYFASKYILERLGLDRTIAPNLKLSVYPGGHMFYTRTDAREQFHADVKAMFETSSSASGSRPAR